MKGFAEMGFDLTEILPESENGDNKFILQVSFTLKCITRTSTHCLTTKCVKQQCTLDEEYNRVF